MPKVKEPKENKFRNWQTIIYEDSCTPNWRQLLTDNYPDVKFAISPLHDKDLKEDGTLKKPHHHILMIFRNRVRILSFNEICKAIGAKEFISPKDNIVRDVKKAKEYHTHENNPEKYQYDERDETYINTPSVICHLCTETIRYIDDNNIWSIRGMVKSLINDGNTQILDYVSHNTYFINQYLSETVEKQKSEILECVRSILIALEEEDEFISRNELTSEYETLKNFIENED